MLKSPLLVLLELVVGLITQMLNTFQFMYAKLLELFIVLSIVSGMSPIGFALAIFLFSIVLFFVLKYIFGSSRILMLLFLIYIFLIGMVIITLSYMPLTIETPT
jgi:hypothetical protein